MVKYSVNFLGSRGIHRMVCLSEKYRLSCKAVYVYLAVIMMAGSALRLPYLSYPGQVVFDEVGFGKLVTAYGWTGERLFDIHPPIGKLLITAAGYLGGYSGKIDFTKIGNPCVESVAPLRVVPAIAGSLIPSVVFFLIAQLGGSLAAAFLCGLFMAFDNAFVVQSRLIGLDTLLVLFIFSSISSLLAARNRTGIPRLTWMAFSGIMAGLAVGTKFTGLTAAGLAVVVLTDDLLRKGTFRQKFDLLGDGVIFMGSAAGIYLLGWKIHFLLMKFPGEGDAFYVPTGRFFHDFLQLHRIMLSANAGITTPHPYSSYWWQWLVMKKPIYYWVNGDAGIYFLGNPVVWWGTGLVFFWLLGYLIFARSRNLGNTLAVDRQPMLWIPLAGYLISILPLVPIHRPLFLYHYLPSLTFSLLAAAIWLDVLGFTRQTTLAQQRFTYFGVAGCCILVFVLLSPVTYGLPPLSPYQKMLGWIGFGP